MIMSDCNPFDDDEAQISAVDDAVKYSETVSRAIDEVCSNARSVVALVVVAINFGTHHASETVILPWIILGYCLILR